MIPTLSYLQPVLEIAQVAGQKIMAVYAGDFSIEHKDNHTPLTEADMASHHYIVDALQRLQPELPVLSEESVEVSYEERRNWQNYWLVDPLDGTQEFIRRNGEFTVNIALIQNHVATLGVIVAPVTGITYYGASGAGAFCVTEDKLVSQIGVREVRPGKPTVITSHSKPGDRLQSFQEQLGDHEWMRLGSSLKSCQVAHGIADIYPRFGHTGEWDTAAAQIIVEQAGGLVTDLSMQPLRYNTKPSLINPDFLVFGDRSHNWRRYLIGSN